MNPLAMPLMLAALQKGVEAGNITAIVPEDLEIEAHNTLWGEDDETELTLVRLLPRVPATSVLHQFAKITSYGYSRNRPFMSEKTLPVPTNFGSERVEVNIKLAGEMSDTFILASLEKTINALGTTGADNIERVALELNLWRKINRELYFSDTTQDRLGANGLTWKGLEQQIREGTDGTVGTASPYGSHVIDLRGQPLRAETVRDKVAQIITQFGRPSVMIMDPFARADFEKSFDGSNRITTPLLTPFTMGQEIQGMRTQNGVVRFLTDNILNFDAVHPKYVNVLPEGIGAPTTTPTLSTATASSSPSTSMFTADDAGDYFYVVTEVVDGIESLGTRTPSGTTEVAVVADDIVSFTITPGNPLANSFNIYRGQGNEAVTEARRITTIANSGGGAAVSFVDRNENLPDCSTAFMLSVKGPAADALLGSGGYMGARENSASLIGTRPLQSKDTCALAVLGPQMGVMQLAPILPTVSRPLLFMAGAPECRNPYQNIVFKNVGRA